MIKIENVVVSGWEAAIRGMRNPMNSWSQSDSHVCNEYTIREEMPCQMVENDNEPCKDCNDGKYGYCVGKNDWVLMRKLSAAGSVHGKYLRFITVTMDVTAPMYWWSEYDTYKVGTVANSCSKMHKLLHKPFEMSDFSFDKLPGFQNEIKQFRPVVDEETELWRRIDADYAESVNVFKEVARPIVDTLNELRDSYFACENEVSKKQIWHSILQLLPESYNQRRTVLLNYAVLANIYQYRKEHKLDEWRNFCKWIETLPYSEVITGERDAQAPEADGAST